MTIPSNPLPETTQLPSASVSLQPQYHLVLMDDDDHSYAYVVEMLGHVFGYAPEKAFALACAVDGTGSAIVETASHDHVTAHQQQIHSYGSDPRIPHCKGSMSAVVESAP